MRIISLLLAFVAVYIFGYESEYSKISHEQLSNYNRKTICQEIMDYYETGDISLVEERMSKNLRDQYEDIGEETKIILDTLPGEIIEWTIRPYGFSTSTKDGNGGIVSKYQTTIDIQTTEGSFFIDFLYAAVSTVEPEEAGFRSFSLNKKIPTDPYSFEPLRKISANTEIKTSVENPPTDDEINKIYIEYIKNCLSAKSL